MAANAVRIRHEFKDAISFILGICSWLRSASDRQIVGRKPTLRMTGVLLRRNHRGNYISPPLLSYVKEMLPKHESLHLITHGWSDTFYKIVSRPASSLDKAQRIDWYTREKDWNWNWKHNGNSTDQLHRIPVGSPLAHKGKKIVLTFSSISRNSRDVFLKASTMRAIRKVCVSHFNINCGAAFFASRDSRRKIAAPSRVADNRDALFFLAAEPLRLSRAIIAARVPGAARRLATESYH